MDNQSVNEAIEILINNFTHHPGLNHTNEAKINVFDVLQEFWQMKADTLNLPKECLVPKYDFMEKPGTPFVCFVTLHGGACFGTFQVSFKTSMLFEKSFELLIFSKYLF